LVQNRGIVNGSGHKFQQNKRGQAVREKERKTDENPKPSCRRENCITWGKRKGEGRTPGARGSCTGKAERNVSNSN